MHIEAIQDALREQGFDAWLFYDHHHRDPIAYRILGLPATAARNAALVLRYSRRG